MGGAFYDEGEVFERYRSAVHPGPASASFVMEEPAVLEAIGDVGGLRILDLGCGDAAIGRRLLQEGCRDYVGIDASARIFDAAHAALHGTTGETRRDTIERVRATRGAVRRRSPRPHPPPPDPALPAARRER